jgi:GNAT superfamily N-acetyltransferase
MWWRLKTSEFERMSRDARETAFRAHVAEGPPPGLVAYEGDIAVGWVQVTPRAALPRFSRSRIAKSSDDDIDQIWAVSCFFVRKGHRRSGMMTELARAACTYASERGASAVEAAALEPKRPMMWGEGFVGLASALARAGFTEVERRSETRVLMRWVADVSQVE